MLWGPFLIKKLLKSVICGSVNNAQKHCSRKTWSTIAAWKKRKKKGKRRKKKHGHTKAQFKHIQRLPKSQLKEIRESIAMNLRRLKP